MEVQCIIFIAAVHEIHIRSDYTHYPSAHRPCSPHPLSTHTKPLETHTHTGAQLHSVAIAHLNFWFQFLEPKHSTQNQLSKILIHVVTNISLCLQSSSTIHIPSQAHTFTKYTPSHTCHHAHPIELGVEPARVTDGVSIFCSPPKNSLHGAAIGTLVVHALQRGFLWGCVDVWVCECEREEVMKLRNYEKKSST